MSFLENLKDFKFCSMVISIMWLLRFAMLKPVGCCTSILCISNSGYRDDNFLIRNCPRNPLPPVIINLLFSNWTLFYVLIFITNGSQYKKYTNILQRNMMMFQRWLEQVKMELFWLHTWRQSAYITGQKICLFSCLC